MLRGLRQLTWLEIRIFVREPLGLLASVVIPVLLFVGFGRAMGARAQRSERLLQLLGEGLPIFISIFIAVSAALSLATVIAVYREGGILKRLRATPLRPPTILIAHVLVKLFFTGIAVVLMMLAGRRFYPVALDVDLPSFILAVLVSTTSIVSIGFVIASIVPTARFAQPIGSLVLYPMLAISGIFAPIDRLSQPWRTVAGLLPTTHAVEFLRGAWAGASWLEHLPNLAALGLTIVVCVAISARTFRWE